MKLLLICFLLLLGTISGLAQIVHNKHLLANGAFVLNASDHTSISSVGEMAVHELSNGIISGTIGFLDYDRLLFPLAIPPNQVKTALSVFPNPTNRGTTASIVSPNAMSYSLKVFDTRGQEIWQEQYYGSSKEIIFPEKLFIVSGNYLIELIAGNYRIVRQLSVVK